MNDTSRTVRVTYEGPPPLVSALAQMLREDGRTQVAYEPPTEQRDALGTAGFVLSTVDLFVSTTGTDEYIKAAVKGFIEKFRRADPRVAINGQPISPDATTGSVADELAKLAGLHADGHLTDEEFAQAKARILGTNT